MVIPTPLPTRETERGSTACFSTFSSATSISSEQGQSRAHNSSQKHHRSNQRVVSCRVSSSLHPWHPIGCSMSSVDCYSRGQCLLLVAVLGALCCAFRFDLASFFHTAKARGLLLDPTRQSPPNSGQGGKRETQRKSCCPSMPHLWSIAC